MTRFIDDYLLYLLAQASTRASAAFHAQVGKAGLPVSTWRILACLYPDAPTGINDLAEACLTKQSTMTRQIDRLVDAGLVTRSAGEADRRRVAVRLTDTGRAMAEDLISKAKHHEAQILAELDPQEVAGLKAALTKLTGASSVS